MIYAFRSTFAMRYIDRKEQTVLLLWDCAHWIQPQEHRSAAHLLDLQDFRNNLDGIYPDSLICTLLLFGQAFSSLAASVL
jgi:hypothetical protein